MSHDRPSQIVPTKGKAGLWQATFEDVYGDPCLISDSTLGYPAGLWLGAEESPIHLSQPIVQTLMPHLARFAARGTIDPDTSSAPDQDALIQSLRDESIKLLELLREANERLRQLAGTAADPLIVEIAVATGDVPAELEPAYKIIEPWRRGFAKHHAEARRAYERAIKERDSEIDYKSRHPAENDDERAHDVKTMSNLVQQIEQTKRSLETADRIAPVLRDNPLSLLLPIGTVVRASAIGEESAWPIPADGSIGVVVGYRPEADRPMLVAFHRTTKDTRGGTCYSNPERPWKLHYRIDELEVLSYSKLVGSAENRAIGYFSTHRHTRGDPLLHGEDMLFRALNWTWRVQEINGLPELTQMSKTNKYFLEWMEPIEGKSA